MCGDRTFHDGENKGTNNKQKQYRDHRHCKLYWLWDGVVDTKIHPTKDLLLSSRIRRIERDLSKYPRDKVILFQIPRCLYAPSFSPFPLKLETYLRMAKIPYEVGESWHVAWLQYLCPLIVVKSWWRHQMETFVALLAFVRGIHRSPVDLRVWTGTETETPNGHMSWCNNNIIITSKRCRDVVLT